MTPGLLVLILVLATAECVALLLRRRAITRRRWAAEEAENETWLASLALPRQYVTVPAVQALGLPMYVSRYLPDNVQGIVFNREAFPPAIEWSTSEHDIMDDLARARRDFTLSSVLIVRPDAAATIVGSAL